MCSFERLKNRVDDVFDCVLMVMVVLFSPFLFRDRLFLLPQVVGDNFRDNGKRKQGIG